MLLKVLVESALPAQIVLLMFDSSCLGTQAFELFIVLGRWFVFFVIHIHWTWLQVSQAWHKWLESCSEVLSVLSILFRWYHLYFQPKPAVRSHRSKEWLCGYCTVRISHTLTTAVKTRLWENHSQTLRLLKLLLISREVDFCSILLQHCATDCSLACSLCCWGALQLFLWHSTTFSTSMDHGGQRSYR